MHTSASSPPPGPAPWPSSAPATPCRSGSVTSAELDRQLGLETGSVARISGVQQRHVADPADTAASLGASAAAPGPARGGPGA